MMLAMMDPVHWLMLLTLAAKYDALEIATY